MADDGLLLNFSVGDAPLTAKSSFTGGHWRDKLIAKRVASGRQRKQANRSTRGTEAQETLLRGAASNHPLSDISDRPYKRPRVETTPSNKKKVDESNQFVSSLFTSNPKPQTLANDEPEILDQGPIDPSNAPLTSELVNFTSLGLSPSLAGHLLNKLEIKSPTAIQKKALTQLMNANTDALLQAETGSGKTLAYLLPIVQHLMSLATPGQTEASGRNVTRIQRDSGLFALILAPTRELCKQISIVLEGLLRCAHWIVAGTVAGGENKKSEKARLRKGLNVLVATPGRLTDHLANTKVLDVSRVRWLVLDEGDRLMELGFEQDIQRIISNLNLQSQKVHGTEIAGLPRKRTTILCSATMKMEVEQLRDVSLKDPAHIRAEGKQEDTQGEGQMQEVNSFSAPAQLKQSYAIVPAKMRLVSLVAVLRRAFARKGTVAKAIVFLSCADSVNFHFDLLARDQDGTESNKLQSDPERQVESRELSKPSEAQTSASSPTLSGPENTIQIFRLHGSLPQPLRTSTLSAYAKSTRSAVLLCTDVASRGLDVANVDLVIEYDPAFSKEEHLHRIGRTARAGRDGRALVFLMPGDEENYTQVLKQGRRDAGIGIARHDADELLQRGFGTMTRALNSKSREWEERATEWQLNAERWVQESLRTLEQARRAFQSHVRAYATHVAAERQYFNVKGLHLGHLAKAFALRDKPGSIKVPGLRPGKENLAKDRLDRKAQAGSLAVNGLRKENRGGTKAETDIPKATDAQEAARKMRAKMKQMSGASEFNIG
ncbi:ATP-dependent RNA helicase dbp7 [Viridothelium virens]|uniref:ATP-dependent RNA helicase n=1 Tax=Viridothelium virens TaxID=1048519 RepID=A0A6A6HQ40_VIRVR|nr:ATP-dependent RNA helicase dbp7 [Viridothelium virens]